MTAASVFRLIRILPCMSIFFSLSAAAADPDVNGYEVQYERDVEAFVAEDEVDCDQIITVADTKATIEGKLNGLGDIFCIKPGDYTTRGTIVITANGTQGAYKVLQYIRTDDSDDEPWNQDGSSNNSPAILHSLALGRGPSTSNLSVGGNYWIIHRVTLNPSYGFSQNVDPSGLPGLNTYALQFWGSNNIVNRSLITHARQILVKFRDRDGVRANNNTVQSSVLRETYVDNPDTKDMPCISVGSVAGARIVNNEMRDCTDGVVATQGTNIDGLIVENNDFYLSDAWYRGNGDTACAENGIDIKNGGSVSSPVRILHNRLWGYRKTDSTCTGGSNGSNGDALLLNEVAGVQVKSVLVQNNIITDSARGITQANGTPSASSIIGNILYDIHGKGLANGQIALQWSQSDFMEWYFNTVVDAAHFYTALGGTNGDMRCNAFVDAGAPTPPNGNVGSGSVVGDNVFYGTTSHPVTPNHDVIKNPIEERTNGVSYNVGDILRVGSAVDCATTPNASCFLYEVTHATGPSASGNYCTTLGCTTQDGGITVKAVRGPYTFYRKLRTGPELHVIPYATVHDSAAEAEWCSGTNVGARQSIGVSNDTLGNGVLATDVAVKPRTGTAGALNATSGGGSGGTQTPYPPGAPPHAIPGTIEAEKYDTGGQHVAYYDTTTGNSTTTYRSDDVDIKTVNGVTYVHNNKATEWLEYTVNVASAGTYTLELRTASAGAAGVVRVEFNGVDKTQAIQIPTGTGWQDWQSVTRTVNLDAGQQIMRIYNISDNAANGGYVGNIDYVRVTSVPVTGSIRRDYWLGINGVLVSNLTSHPNYPNSPSGTDTLTQLEGPVNWNDNYGTRIRGYVHPPTTGNYTFWIASDDTSELYLSTDDNPANKQRIAYSPDWTGYREWTKYAVQHSVPITLQAGQRYYIEALHKDGTSGDHVSVRWQLPDGTFEAPIPGNRLSPVQ